ncbi:unnamed protein product [Sphenostylis stenocarpa]|uniref:Uncharacterized protein n=1 Tax=Sphenostylis stenocarpa TaxID=92480 RepID=A0AA86VLD0_9FABA|nr:unnamed protein product [Sphenostylis stenocarpa]
MIQISSSHPLESGKNPLSSVHNYFIYNITSFQVLLSNRVISLTRSGQLRSKPDPVTRPGSLLPATTLISTVVTATRAQPWPQQLKYITFLRESSACATLFSTSELPVTGPAMSDLTTPDKGRSSDRAPPEKRRLRFWWMELSAVLHLWPGSV